MEDPTSATQDTSKPTPALETDETNDKESPDMETDDPDTMTSVPEPPPVLQSAFSVTVASTQNSWQTRICSGT